MDAREALRKVCARGLLDFVDLDVAMEPLQLNYGMPTVFMEEHVYAPFVEQVRSAAGDVPVLSVLGRVTRMSDAEAAISARVLRHGRLSARTHRRAALRPACP